MTPESVPPAAKKRDGRAITIANVDEGECHYLLGHGSQAALCANPVVRPDSSWCEYHAKLCASVRRVHEGLP